MKLFYTLLNVILLIVIVLFARLHLHYRDDHKVNVVTKTLRELPQSSKDKVVGNMTVINHSRIGGLFNRERARLDQSDTKGGEPRITSTSLPLVLTGIMSFGGEGGAMISERKTSKFKRVNGKESARKKKYFKVGDTVYKGYKLTEIAEDFVKLVNGTQEATLQLEKKSFGTNKKEKSKLNFSVRVIE